MYIHVHTLVIKKSYCLFLIGTFISNKSVIDARIPQCFQGLMFGIMCYSTVVLSSPRPTTVVSTQHFTHLALCVYNHHCLLDTFVKNGLFGVIFFFSLKKNKGT